MDVAFGQIRFMAGRRQPFGPPEPVDSEDFTRHIRALADACTPYQDRWLNGAHANGAGRQPQRSKGSGSSPPRKS
ncbi:hypothetical protein GCM10023085_06680 [Actinomadura viridis]